MHAAAWRSNSEIVRLLLGAGADVTCRNDVAETPLIKFARNMTCHTIHPKDSNPRLDAFRILLEAGSDINASDIRGRTVLHILAAHRSTDVDGNELKATSLLLARGIDHLARDAEGNTAADLLQRGDAELVLLLDSHRQDSHDKQEM